MEKVIKFKWFYSQLEGAYELSGARYALPEGWRPSMNAYRFEKCIQVCFDLAGVDKADVDLKIEPTRLLCANTTHSRAASSEGRPRQILAMEIDHGTFARELRLPARVIPGKVSADNVTVCFGSSCQ